MDELLNQFDCSVSSIFSTKNQVFISLPKVLIQNHHHIVIRMVVLIIVEAHHR
jgi:uncharacterized protein with NAD-binding domain and iron-sulfur cluster